MRIYLKTIAIKNNLQKPIICTKIPHCLNWNAEELVWIDFFNYSNFVGWLKFLHGNLK